MQSVKFIKLNFHNKEYEIDIKKLNFVLSKLENKEINIKNNEESEKEIRSYIKKYDLGFEEFLKAVC